MLCLDSVDIASEVSGLNGFSLWLICLYQSSAFGKKRNVIQNFRPLGPDLFGLIAIYVQKRGLYISDASDLAAPKSVYACT